MTTRSKVEHLLQRLRAAVRTARLCKNWPHILAAHGRGKPCSRFVFREGIDLRCTWSDQSNVTIFDEIFLKRHYSRHFDVDPGDVVLDIGGNVGMFLAYAEHRKCGRIVLAEPFRANAETIADNIARNGLDNAVIERVAVGGGPGTALLWVDQHDSGGHSIAVGQESGREQSEEVPTLSFRELLDRQNIDTVDFLKMDCEGAEGMILEGMNSDDLARIRKVAMEYHGNDSSLDHRQIEALFTEAGFRTWFEPDANTQMGYIFAQREA